jgi:hypothetical protein
MNGSYLPDAARCSQILRVMISVPPILENGSELTRKSNRMGPS